MLLNGGRALNPCILAHRRMLYFEFFFQISFLPFHFSLFLFFWFFSWTIFTVFFFLGFVRWAFAWFPFQNRNNCHEIVNKYMNNDSGRGKKRGKKIKEKKMWNNSWNMSKFFNFRKNIFLRLQFVLSKISCFSLFSPSRSGAQMLKESL